MCLCFQICVFVLMYLCFRFHICLFVFRYHYPMLNRVDIKDAVNPSQKILAQLGLTPVLSNPFNHLLVMARIKKN